jgi:hypothetical protein
VAGRTAQKNGDVLRSPLPQSAALMPIGGQDFNIEIDNRFISWVPLGACFPTN